MGKRTFERDTNPRKFIKKMKQLGWAVDRSSSSSHIVFKKGAATMTVKKTDLNIMIQQRLAKELENGMED